MVETKACIECGATSPYKCPTCDSRYCSVACCKTHKQKGCKIPEPVIDTKGSDSKTFLYPTEDTVEEEKLKLLGQNEELKNMLNDTQLRMLLKEINSQSNPERLLKQYMQRPDFTQFADLILKIVEPQENNTC